MCFITPGLALLRERWSGPGGHRAVRGSWPAFPKERSIPRGMSLMPRPRGTAPEGRAGVFQALPLESVQKYGTRKKSLLRETPGY